MNNWKYLVMGLVVNLVVVDVVLVKEIRNTRYEIRGLRQSQSEAKLPLLKAPAGEELEVIPVALPTGVLEFCGLVCQARIAEEVSKAMATVSGERVVEKTVVREVPGESGISGKSGEQAKIVYIPLVASASNTNTDWTDVNPSEFYFDLASYPGAKMIRFSGYLRSVHATGPVYVRLYDVTNKRGVDNSDFFTSSNSFERFESAALSIWRGNNLYRVQLRSPTATEAQVSEVKLKVEW